MRQSTVFVTGATGFVGRYLCTHLASLGYAVRGSYRGDAPSAGYPSSVAWTRIEDIGPDTVWDEVLEGVDCVVHLAALAHQIGSAGEGRLEEFMCTNAGGTRRLAKAVAAAGHISRLVFISSIGAVCSLSDSRLSELTPCQPQTDYGRSKLAAELAVREVLVGTAADWCIIRPSLVYGPGNPGNMARLLRLISRGLPLPLGSIQNLRSFVFVGNLVDVIERCLWHPGASRRVFTVSDGEDISTPELVRRLATHAGRAPRLLPMPISLLKLLGKVGDWAERVLGISTGMDTYSIERLAGSLAVDITALRQVISWEPPYSLDEGIALTVGTASGK